MPPRCDADVVERVEHATGRRFRHHNELNLTIEQMRQRVTRYDRMGPVGALSATDRVYIGEALNAVPALAVRTRWVSSDDDAGEVRHRSNGRVAIVRSFKERPEVKRVGTNLLSA